MMPDSRKTIVLVVGLFLSITCIGLVVGGFLLAGLLQEREGANPPLIFPTRSSATAVIIPSSVPSLTANPQPADQPQGKIVYVCQVFKLQEKDQLCMINADGTNMQRLTEDDEFRHFYPSISPDGGRVFFSSNLDGNFKIYEMDLESGQVLPLGNTVGIAPEVSPDDQYVVYANSNGESDMIWIMERDGNGQRMLFSPGWDPTWSPDGERILFATEIGGLPQLASIDREGNDFQQLTELPLLRGRSDWSPDGRWIVTYAGKPWEREIILINTDDLSFRQVSPPGGNSQGPSFSPDGQWIAFTSYFGSIGNVHACEIYIMRIDGSDLRRLTTNTHCDWQPRWGN